MDPLKAFNGDTKMRDSVRAFMVNVLREMAADNAISGKSTDGIKDASMCIEKVFDRLEDAYGVKKAPKEVNSR